MKTTSFFVSLFFGTLLASTASAQVRTFVASTGSDINPCSRTAPCRNFQAAVNVVQPGGEVVALDSGEFGPINITKAVSIFAAPEVYATITPSSSDAISINAGATDAVTLRGLSIVGSAVPAFLGTHGVIFHTGAMLHIENCDIHDFQNPHLAFIFAGAGNLEIKDSTIRDSYAALDISPVGPTLVTIDRVRIEGARFALAVFGPSKVTIRDSIIAANTYGLEAEGGELTMENCTVSNNSDHGIFADGNVIVRLSNSTVTNNNIGIHNFGGGAVVLSRGNNTVEGNGADTVGVLGIYTAK